MQNRIVFREIKLVDNEAIANIIRTVLIEFGGNRPGTAFYDKSVDTMYQNYQVEKGIYLVALIDNEIVGGCGIKKLDGLDVDYCELQKLYLLEHARGSGIGRLLTEKCLEFAKSAGYKKCYLESFPNMNSAINLYKKLGFYILDAPIGNTGHGGCDIWMMKDLAD